jgi:hypothetical protein
MLDSTSETARSVRALHRVLAKARYLALQGSSTQQLAGILDWAERLADDIASSEDHLQQFTEHLGGLGEDHPEFAGILSDYTSGR